MKKIFIGIGILAAVIIFMMAIGALKFNVSIAPSDQAAEPKEQPKEQKEAVIPEGWLKYNSGEFGYTIAYPDNWNLLEQSSGGSRNVVIAAPQNKAIVRVAAFIDQSLSTPEAVEASMAEYKASFEAKPDELLKQFQSKMQGDIGGFEASGFVLINGIQYQFLERGLLATNGRVLILRGAVNTKLEAQEDVDAHGAIVKQILNSFGTH